MSTVVTNGKRHAAAGRKGRSAGRPSQRNCQVYERAMFNGETYEAIATDYGISRHRIAAIVARVEGWIADHPRHELARKMRVECGRRWQAIWSRAIESFDYSRQDRRTSKERAARRRSGLAGDHTPVMTVTEQTVREQNGDPRFLTIATRVAERQDRLWMHDDEVGRPSQVADTADETSDPGGGIARGQRNGTESVPYRFSASLRFACLPAALGDLEQLACGLRHGTEADSRNGTESVPYRATEALTPISTLFEQLCAEAFRCLGFDVRELGQGCGRVADCLAIAAVERFAVIIDAKVRRRGYTLGTDDRQFCEYAMRHTRELALSGTERVYFAVIGHGFRQDDLDKLAGFMTGTPIRSVVFIEAEALMRLVNDSIRKRREFRLTDIDQLLFGNKIIHE
jgi:hypothetical protein